MERPRWLLPFTCEVDMDAIDLVVDFAERAGATLVAVSLISDLRTPRSRGARLEHIQQSKDFLEAVRWKVERHSLPIERYEIFTRDVIQDISLLVADMQCDAIVLVTTGEREVFLQTHELKSLLEHAPSQLLIIRMSMAEENAQSRTWLHRILSWLHLTGRPDAHTGDVSLGKPDVPEAAEPAWVRTEG